MFWNQEVWGLQLWSSLPLYFNVADFHQVNFELLSLGGRLGRSRGGHGIGFSSEEAPVSTDRVDDHWLFAHPTIHHYLSWSAQPAPAHIDWLVRGTLLSFSSFISSYSSCLPSPLPSFSLSSSSLPYFFPSPSFLFLAQLHWVTCLKQLRNTQGPILLTFVALLREERKGSTMSVTPTIVWASC